MNATADNLKLYNRADLAKALGVKPWFIRRLVAQGFPMPFGVSTPAKVHAFLAEMEARETCQAPTRRQP